MNLEHKQILITGASGFIGSHLVERALAEGAVVWAAVRPTSSRRYLSDSRIRFVELDLGDSDRLRAQLEHHCAGHGPWDYVIHAAGATKCRRESDFFRVNTEGTLRLARLLVETGALTGRMVFISSLSVCGPIHETDGGIMHESDEPRPDTAYGRSKLEAERRLALLDHAPDYVILRPTGVYGPRERDYYLMAKSIARRVDFSVGWRPQVLTFIYVADLVEAAILALERGESGRAYFLTDGGAYASRDFSDLLSREMGIHSFFRIKAPLWMLRVVCGIVGGWAAATGRTATLNMDKYHIMKQRNWQCDIGPARRELGYVPRFPLERGVAETVAWYKKERWL